MAAGVAEVMGDSVFTMDGEDLYQVTAEKISRGKGFSFSLRNGNRRRNRAMLCRYPDCAEILDCSIVVPAGRISGRRTVGFQRSSRRIYHLQRGGGGSACGKSFRRTGSALCLSVTGNAGPDYCDGVGAGNFLHQSAV